ncbi:methyltransferase domain-containing protein [Shimia ponticola]|uniref:methyltransferase domain-containing protein n=1 Tax=Shimia ponticola TaxID=2582893 RepID=UPI0011BDE4C5|nr:RsmB/NOP family class I SAM-dependent RNA methyltransferase [Shimia ponticola]
MTPAARIAAAIEVLDQVLEGTAAEKALLGWARRSRFAGSKDRAALRDIVFQCLRCRRSYAAMGGSLTGRGLVRGFMSDTGTPEADIFGATRHAPPVLDDPPLTPWDNLSEGDQADLQDWVYDRLCAEYGSQARMIAQALRQQAPIWLRVNAQRTDSAAVSRNLSDAGFEIQASKDVPTALQVTRPARGLANLDAAQAGLFEFQDLSSQRAIAALGDLHGVRVLDFCAGGGGKALAMAAAGASVTAHDRDPRRMKDFSERAKRAQVHINTSSLADLKGQSFDLVVCDVPCSGSGAWRRSLETKWTLTPTDLTDLIDLQRGIAQTAVGFMKPEGRLSYMTCSLFSAENAEQAEWIDAHLPVSKTLAHQMIPLDGGDGFFVSIYQG